MTDVTHDNYTYSAIDGAVLIEIENEIRIIRRRKHEWHDGLDANNESNFVSNTDSLRGSKFASNWTTESIARWTAEQIRRLGWTRGSSPTSVVIRLDVVIGFCKGRSVYDIKIELSSGYAHAYPYEA